MVKKKIIDGNLYLIIRKFAKRSNKNKNEENNNLYQRR